MSMNHNDIAILNIKAFDYHWIISLSSKNEAISLTQNANLTGKSGTFLSHIKRSKEILTLGGIEIAKNKFYHNKTPIFLKDVNIEKLLVSEKISFGEKTIGTELVTCKIIIKLSHYI